MPSPESGRLSPIDFNTFGQPEPGERMVSCAMCGQPNCTDPTHKMEHKRETSIQPYTFVSYKGKASARIETKPTHRSWKTAVAPIEISQEKRTWEPQAAQLVWEPTKESMGEIIAFDTPETSLSGYTVAPDGTLFVIVYKEEGSEFDIMKRKPNGSEEHVTIKTDGDRSYSDPCVDAEGSLYLMSNWTRYQWTDAEGNVAVGQHHSIIRIQANGEKSEIREVNEAEFGLGYLSVNLETAEICFTRIAYNGHAEELIRRKSARNADTLRLDNADTWTRKAAQNTQGTILVKKRSFEWIQPDGSCTEIHMPISENLEIDDVVQTPEGAFLVTTMRNDGRPKEELTPLMRIDQEGNVTKLANLEQPLKAPYMDAEGVLYGIRKNPKHPGENQLMRLMPANMTASMQDNETPAPPQRVF